MCKSPFPIVICTDSSRALPVVSRDLTHELLAAMAECPVVTVLGPRQSGKTTLARLAEPSLPYRSPEESDIRSAAEADPRGFLADLSAGGILDEVQRLPPLLPYLQDLVDEAARSGARAFDPLRVDDLWSELVGPA